MKDREDGSIGIRCSCQAAICGSCGVRVNGQAKLACNTKLSEAAAEPVRVSQRAGIREPGEITVEPMGNMPVLKDLIVNMDAVHWKKVQRVVPWLLPAGDPPEREYVVPAGDDDRRHAVDGLHPLRRVRLRLPLDGGRSALHRARPRSRRPTASSATRATRRPRSACATSPRTRTGSTTARTASTASRSVPKGVAPMDQIMRLRRRATRDFEINDQNNGRRHEHAFTKIIQKKGILDERKLLQDSFGPFRPEGGIALLRALPTGLRGFARGKITPRKALFHEGIEGMENVRRIYDHAENHGEEINLYILGEGGEGRCAPRKQPAMGETPRRERQ